MSHTPILTIVPLIGNQKRSTLLWKGSKGGTLIFFRGDGHTAHWVDAVCLLHG